MNHDEDRDGSEQLALSAEAYEVAGITVGTWSGRQDPAADHPGNRAPCPTTRAAWRSRRPASGAGLPGSSPTTARGSLPARSLAWIDSPELGAAQADYLRAENMSRLRTGRSTSARSYCSRERPSAGEHCSGAKSNGKSAEAEAAGPQSRSCTSWVYHRPTSRSSPSNQAGRGVTTYPVRATIERRAGDRDGTRSRDGSSRRMPSCSRLPELESLWLFLQVFEKDLPSVREGAIVTLTCESHPEDHFPWHDRLRRPGPRSAQPDRPGPSRHRESGRGAQAGDVRLREHRGGAATKASRPASRCLATAAVAKVEGRDVVFVQTAERSASRSGRSCSARRAVTGSRSVPAW